MTVYRFTEAPMHASCWIILCDCGNGILIDPCVKPENVYSKLGHSVKITHILITHGHFDHISRLDEWKAVTEAEVYISSDDAVCLSSPKMNVSSAFYGMREVVCKTQPDVLLLGGEEVSAGDIKIKVFSAPGHTPGGLLYLIKDCLFSGDTLFMRSYGRTDLCGGDEEALESTLCRMREFYGKGITLYPGHGECCEFDDAYVTM